MRELQLIAVDNLATAVDELCLKFGTWKTARALLRAALRRRQTNQISHLSNRMRRDIGLPEIEASILEARFPLWDIRL